MHDAKGHACRLRRGTSSRLLLQGLLSTALPMVSGSPWHSAPPAAAVVAPAVLRMRPSAPW